MYSKLYRSLAFVLVAFSVTVFTSCREEGLINKTKYQGQKIKNYCADFEEEVSGLVEANQGTSVLRVAEYDNSQFDYFYLEPGQMEQIGDTLYMRLINDINYDKYLHKRVAVHVQLGYSSQDHLVDLEEDPQGELSEPLVIDRDYYNANSDPFFVYKFPVGNKLNGKQVTLYYSIVQYKKNGSLKRVFCNTEEVPLGPLDPPCCTEQPWREVKAQSVVQIPELDIDDETYRYKGFTGTVDLIFPMNSVEYDEDELNDVLLNFISKYEKQGYQVQSIDLTGYASQGGTVEYNQDLSDNRSTVVYENLQKHFEESDNSSVSISHRGLGEDWERFNLLVKTAVFTDEERQKLLDIANSAMSDDEKEAELRKLPFWEKLIKEVLVYNRHVMVEFTFQYQPDKMYVEMYPSEMPIIAPELYNVATKKMTISKFRPGADVSEGMGILNTLINVNGNEKANLYAMRSTYHFAENNVQSAINDIESAMNIDSDNSQYGLAALSYKTQYADNYTITERMNMLNEYNSFSLRNPNNAMLQYNRVVMMDKVGFISGALAEYEELITESSKTAALLNNRGVARLKTNRLTEAEADFQEAIRLDPKLAHPYFNLAVIYAYKGMPDKCITNLGRAIELNPALKDGIFRNPVFSVVKTSDKFREQFR
mgnify:CR=1 FL=1